jgi:hypothetical protein
MNEGRKGNEAMKIWNISNYSSGCMRTYLSQLKKYQHEKIHVCIRRLSEFQKESTSILVSNKEVFYISLCAFCKTSIANIFGLNSPIFLASTAFEEIKIIINGSYDMILI